MATITLKYDARNPVIKSILNSAVIAGATVVNTKTKNLSPVEKSLEDIKHGRVTRVKDISKLLDECKK